MNINGYKIKIEEIEDITDKRLMVDNTPSFGTFDPCNKTIYMWKNNTKEHYNAVLIHEVTHAYMFALGWNTFEQDEESLCYFMEYHARNVLKLAEKYMR